MSLKNPASRPAAYSSSNQAGGSDDPPDNRGKSAKGAFRRTFFSVIQASFGVQSNANRQRDFESGSVAGFAAAAVFFTFTFVLALVLIVSLVLG